MCWFEPVISEEGIVYLGLNQTRQLAALDTEGVLLWERELCMAGLSYPAIISNDHRLYLKDSEGRLLCIDADGGLRWFYRPRCGGVASSAALCQDGCVLVHLSGRRLARISPAGEELQVIEMRDQCQTPPISCADGKIICTSTPPPVDDACSWVEVFASNGQKQWELEVRGEISAAVLADDGLLCLQCVESLRRKKPIPALNKQSVIYAIT